MRHLSAGRDVQTGSVLRHTSNAAQRPSWDEPHSSDPMPNVQSLFGGAETEPLAPSDIDHKVSRWRPRSTALRFRAFSYLIALDIVCIVASFAFAASLRGALFDDAWVRIVALLVPIYLFVGVHGRAYSEETLADPLHTLARGSRGLLVALAMMTLAAYYLKTSTDLPRLTVAIGWLSAAMSVGVVRYFYVRHLHAIVGGNPFGAALIWERGQPIPPMDFALTIVADDRFDPERHDPFMYDRLAKALDGVHKVVVSCRPEQRLAWTHALKGANVQSEILMPELEALAPLGINAHAGQTALVVAHGPLGLTDRVVKRLFDVAVASLALVVLAPAMIAVAIAIKLTSEGPVFFRQTRIGRGNKVFEVLKFRSMRVEASDHAGDRSASRDDERITAVGRFIRKTSIDELPQLINILRGDMSVVGPRPHALGSRAADKLFWEVDGRYWHRHAAKPGLTGLAQVRGYRGATLAEDDLRNRLQADLEYLEAWSIWRDLKIIVQTFQVLVHRNAF
jgi:lipopolysaccharide/colanic/teichoic acid biosynthesis glycosyltransferase